jgi:hypothetical protein
MHYIQTFLWFYWDDIHRKMRLLFSLFEIINLAMQEKKKKHSFSFMYLKQNYILHLIFIIS